MVFWTGRDAISAAAKKTPPTLHIMIMNQNIAKREFALTIPAVRASNPPSRRPQARYSMTSKT